MKRLLFILSFLIPFLGFSQNITYYYTLSDGNWDDPAIWVTPPGIPPKKIPANSDIEIVVNHNITLNDVLEVAGNSTLRVCGNLTINGDVIVAAKFDLIVCPGANFIVNGNMEIRPNGGFEIAGLAVVTGEFYHPPNNPPLFVGNGVLYVGTKCEKYDDPENSYYHAQIICGDPLPIELLSFTATSKIYHILIEWTTGSEINNDYFSILRSQDLQNWETISTVWGSGNSSIPISYSFVDFYPLSGISYYKLKQTDFDGKFEEFQPVAVEWKVNGVKVYQYGETITVFAPEHIGQNIWVTDVQGRSLYREKIYGDRTQLNLRGNIFFITIFNNNNIINLTHVKR